MRYIWLSIYFRSFCAGRARGVFYFVCYLIWKIRIFEYLFIFYLRLGNRFSDILVISAGVIG